MDVAIAVVIVIIFNKLLNLESQGNSLFENIISVAKNLVWYNPYV